jgi:hypothetical protein
MASVAPLHSLTRCEKLTGTDIGQSPRDDLESLCYLLSYLHHGSLPWDHPYPSPTQPHIWRRKMITPASTLFAGMNTVYEWFFKEVKALAYAEVPDYDRMRGVFTQCWQQRGFEGEEGSLDWWVLWDSTDETPLWSSKNRGERASMTW